MPVVGVVNWSSTPDESTSIANVLVFSDDDSGDYVYMTWEDRHMGQSVRPVSE